MGIAHVVPSNRRMIVELPAAIRPATAVKGSLLQSSLAAVERLGLTEPYFRHLGPEHAAAIRQVVVGQWHPMELALAHYGAIEKLGLAPQQSKQNGRLVAEKVQVGFARIVFRGIGTAVTPLDALRRTPAFFERLIEGGAVSVEQRGPKDAHVEIVQIPIGRYEYVREAWAGMFEATLGLLTHRTMVRNVSARGGDQVSLDIAWV
ncbi:MAG: hypothetical protein U0230_10740 [Polyangiales bacterium]